MFRKSRCTPVRKPTNRFLKPRSPTRSPTRVSSNEFYKREATSAPNHGWNIGSESRNIRNRANKTSWKLCDLPKAQKHSKTKTQELLPVLPEDPSKNSEAQTITLAIDPRKPKSEKTTRQKSDDHDNEVTRRGLKRKTGHNVVLAKINSGNLRPTRMRKRKCSLEIIASNRVCGGPAVEGTKCEDVMEMDIQVEENDNSDQVRESGLFGFVIQTVETTLDNPEEAIKQMKDSDANFGQGNEELVTTLCDCAGFPVPNLTKNTKRPRKKNPSFVRCLAIDSIGSTRQSCTNSTKDLSNFRVSSLCNVSGPLCANHLARLRSHLCCPYCGDFCSEGEFMECNGRSSSNSKNYESHLFHADCAWRSRDSKANTLEDTYLCPHCGGIDCHNRKYQYTSSESLIFIPNELDLSFRELTSHFDVRPASRVSGKQKKLPKKVKSHTDTIQGLQHQSQVGSSEGTQQFPLSSESYLEAILENNLLKIKNHLSRSGNPNVTFPSHNMKTAVHFAAELNNLALLDLICKDADLDRTDGDGLTPLMFAAKFGNNNIITKLLYLRADHLIQDKQGWTLLHHAIFNGKRTAVNTILRHDRTLVNIFDKTGLTPLMLAAKQERHRITCCVSNYMKGQRRAILEIDCKQNTSLHWVVRAGYGEIAMQLLDYGAFIDNPNEDGHTPLHTAILFKKYPIAMCLLSRGANPLCMDKAGKNIADLCELSVKDLDGDPDTFKGNYAILSILMLYKAIRKECTDPPKVRFFKCDIAEGNETIRVSAVNSVNDRELPSDFTYITSNAVGSLQDGQKRFTFTLEPHNCFCNFPVTSKSEGDNGIPELFYRKDCLVFNNAESELGTKPLYVNECGSACHCNPRFCKNRVVQSGIKSLLQVFHTPVVNGETKGWGLRTLTEIPYGGFICEYTGEFVSSSELENLSDKSYCIELLRSDMYASFGFVVNSKNKGNLARFVNHSCEPNAIVVNVVVADETRFSVPRLALFALKSIAEEEEITINYGESFWYYEMATGLHCLCSATKCSLNYKPSLM